MYLGDMEYDHAITASHFHIVTFYVLLTWRLFKPPLE